MSNVVGNTTQTDYYSTYHPKCHRCNSNGCSCLGCSAWTKWDKCSGSDWLYSYDTCCGRLCSWRPNCSRLNPANCSIGKNSASVDPFISATWDKTPGIACTFDGNKIDTVPQLTAWSKKFGTTGDYNKILNGIAQRIQTVGCLPDPLTKEVPKQCTTLFQDSDMGKTTKKWFDAKPQTEKDAFIKAVCDKYPTLVECSCYSRTNDATYKQLKPPIMDDDTTPSTLINDGCWWKTCLTNSDRIFLSSDVLNPKCKVNKCQKLANQMNAHNVSPADVEKVSSCVFNYSCDINHNCLPSACTDTSQPICYVKSDCEGKCKPPPGPSGGGSFPVFPVVLGCVGVLVLAILGYLYFRRKKRFKNRSI